MNGMTCPTVAFATTVWEKDWRPILLGPSYLKVQQIENHCFDFAEKILIINNVDNLDEVIKAARKKIDEGVITSFHIANEEVLSFFDLKRSDFRPDPGIHSDWVYYNALGPLAALYYANTDYLLYLTGDVYLPKRVDWIPKTIRRMEKSEKLKVANLVWNENYNEAKKESYKQEWNFFLAKEGFSDQMFLVKRSDFVKPLYNEIHKTSGHFPRGDVFEKRAYSAMKYRGWERLIYRKGFYIHENFSNNTNDGCNFSREFRTS